MRSDPIVLVVDDDDCLCDMLEDLLMDAGYVVLTARSAREAFDALDRYPIDVILTDLDLGIGNGFEILESLTERTPHPEGVLMTAFVNEEIARHARHLGVYETLRKPFQNHVVIKAVEQARQRHSADLAK